MKRIESNCVGCTDLGLHCLGDGCPNKEVTKYYCDYCGTEEKLYHYDDLELCEECLLKQFKIVDGSDF